VVRNICSWVAEAVGDVPFFAKMTPNVTDVREIACAALEGGATGVTAVNTVSGLMGFNSQGSPWPGVGDAAGPKYTTYGGVSGNAIRPIGLKAVSSICSAMPGIPVMATGGIDSGTVALQYIQLGAPALQICSAVQNQDFTVVYDYSTALQWQLYSRSRADFDNWDGQTPPEAHKVHHGRESASAGLPRFGVYAKERQLRRRDLAESERVSMDTSLSYSTIGDLPDKVPEVAPEPTRPVGTIASEMGKALQSVKLFTELDISKQVVAVVDSDVCINCGKCYMACNDSGYQAIHFTADTHFPIITDECTGCTLCLSVCPVVDCITMQSRDTIFPHRPYKPFRGIAPAVEVGGTLAGQVDRRVTGYDPKKIMRPQVRSGVSVESRH